MLNIGADNRSTPNQHMHFQTYTHEQEYLDHGQSEGGSALHYLIGLDHDMGLMCVCCWTNRETFRVAEIFFLFSNGWSIFFICTIEKFGRMCNQMVAL